jgi:hypothetical protein
MIYLSFFLHIALLFKVSALTSPPTTGTQFTSYLTWDNNTNSFFLPISLGGNGTPLNFTPSLTTGMTSVVTSNYTGACGSGVFCLSSQNMSYWDDANMTYSCSNFDKNYWGWNEWNIRGR